MNHYATLGLPLFAAADEVRPAYRQKALLCHPDKVRTGTSQSEATANFQLIQESYEVLSNPTQKSLYDTKLRQTMSTSSFAMNSCQATSEGYSSERTAEYPFKRYKTHQAPSQERAQFHFFSPDPLTSDLPSYTTPYPFTCTPPHYTTVSEWQTAKAKRNAEAEAKLSPLELQALINLGKKRAISHFNASNSPRFRFSVRDNPYALERLAERFEAYSKDMTRPLMIRESHKCLASLYSEEAERVKERLGEEWERREKLRIEEERRDERRERVRKSNLEREFERKRRVSKESRERVERVLEEREKRPFGWVVDLLGPRFRYWIRWDCL